MKQYLRFLTIMTWICLTTFQSKATNSLIELDFKGDETPDRYHVMSRRVQDLDISHVELDTKDRQGKVYKYADGKDVCTTIPFWDIEAFPWELKHAELTRFFAQQTAWLRPTDDSYRLTFKPSLLGGMKNIPSFNITEGTIDCQGLSNWPVGTLGHRYCQKNRLIGDENRGHRILNSPLFDQMHRDLSHQRYVYHDNIPLEYVDYLQEKQRVRQDHEKSLRIKAEQEAFAAYDVLISLRNEHPTVEERTAELDRLGKLPTESLQHLAQQNRETFQGLIQNARFKVHKSNPMAPHDYFDLDGKMGGSGMGGGLGRGIVKNVPPVFQKQPDFKWNVKQSNVADKIGRHPVFGKIYKDPSQKIGNKEVWWSKDTAKHGGAEYKLFEENSNRFSWIGDADSTGNIVLKHKSEIGREIFKSEISWIK